MKETLHGTALAVLLLCAACALGPVSCGTTSQPASVPCETHADCDRPEVLGPLGRCFPKEAYCSAGMCEAACRPLCEVVRPDTNPCPGELVCTDSGKTDQEGAYCTALPVACATAEDCPAYLPAPTGKWECSQGTCTFPEFEYAAEK